MSDTETTETTETPDEEEPITEEQVEEAERDDTEPAPEPEQENVVEDAQEAFDERKKEAGRKRIERAVASMVKTLNDVLADESAYLQPCPRCADDFPGLIWQPAIKQVLPETRAAVMVSMGEDPDPTLNQDPRASRCDRCDGWGRVSTGSRVHRQDKLECTECKGRGWIGPRAAELPSSTVQIAPVLLDHADTNGEAPPQTDPWGRVKGEALYGVMPGYES